MIPPNKTQPTAFNGPNFFALLTVLFIGLKLTGHITWSWVWVFAPLWGPMAAAILIAPSSPQRTRG